MYPFEGHFKLRGAKYVSHSQALQDVFARVVSSWSGVRTYLEIGAGDPESGSNTLALERDGWNGLSIEWDGELSKRFGRVRTNKIICGNALSQDYRSLIEESLLQPIGYLQVDIDPAEQSLACLMLIPLDTFRFTCITFEHDRYSQGKRVRNLQRQHLRTLGYVLVRGDVTWKPGHPFEDWWVDSHLLSKKQIRQIGRSFLGVWVPREGPFGMN